MLLPPEPIDLVPASQLTHIAVEDAPLILNPLPSRRPDKLTPTEWLIIRVLALSTVESFFGCWVDEGRNTKYSRFYRSVYRLCCGEVKVGYQLHHLCENPGCHNPIHLQQLTPRAHKRLHRNSKKSSPVDANVTPLL